MVVYVMVGYIKVVYVKVVLHYNGSGRDLKSNTKQSTRQTHR